MDNFTNLTLKMRFRLPNGEEFEAEGTREFIESQRNYFLKLIGHPTPSVPLPVNSALSFAPATTKHTEQYLWEQLFKEDGETLILRKKSKYSAADIAILMLAGVRILFKKDKYSALDLAKSLKASNIEGGRLDRLLIPAIQAGYLSAQGSKRGRAYQLSDSGFTKAYILAEKLLQNQGGI